MLFLVFFYKTVFIYLIFRGHKDVPAGCGPPCASHFGSRRKLDGNPAEHCCSLRDNLAKEGGSSHHRCLRRISRIPPPPRSTPTVRMSGRGFGWGPRRSPCRSPSHLAQRSIRCTASSTSSCPQKGQLDLNLSSMFP